MEPSIFSHLSLTDRVNVLLDPDSGGDTAWSEGEELLIVQGTMQQQSVRIAAQNAAIAGGTLGAAHTLALLDTCEAVLDKHPAAFVLLLDSGGVRLHEGNRGMSGLARVMEQVLAVRRAGTTAIAVIGGSLGCWGGATLIAGVCDKTLMLNNSRYGLSGPKVLQEMARAQHRRIDLQAVKPYLTAAHRLRTGEIDVVVEDDITAVRNAVWGAIQSNDSDPIERAQSALQKSDKRLQDKQVRSHSISAALPGVELPVPTNKLWQEVFESCEVDTSIPGVVAGTGRLADYRIPFFGCTLDSAMGPTQGLALLRSALAAYQVRPPCILLLADAVQAFDIENEQYGYGQILGALAQVLGHTAATVCPVVGWLQCAGSGASMVALSMCGVSLYAHRDAQIHPLPPNVVAKFVGEQARSEIDAGPSPESFQSLRAVKAVWGNDYISCLRKVLLNPGVASSG